MKTLWVEKYRPQTFEQYAGDKHIVEKIEQWIKEGEIPHLLLCGPPGTGKTSLAKIITNSIECDVLYVNASDEGGINFIRNRIIPFAQSLSLERKLKVVILDEADYCTPEFQAALRNTMETYSKRTRFILTANQPDRIISPIQSRCQVFKIEYPLRERVVDIAKRVLDSEGVNYQKDILERIITSYYPDIRRIIQALEKSTVNKTLQFNQHIVENDYLTKIGTLIQSTQPGKKKWLQIRQVLNEQQINYDALYKYLYTLYNNPEATVVIAEHYYRSAFTPDKEITAMAMFKQLIEIK